MVFDQETLDKLVSDVPKYKLITVSVVSDRLKVSGSLARTGIDHLLSKGLIVQVVSHSAQEVYTSAKAPTADKPAEKAEKADKAPKEKAAPKEKKAAPKKDAAADE